MAKEIRKAYGIKKNVHTWEKAYVELTYRAVREGLSSWNAISHIYSHDEA